MGQIERVALKHTLPHVKKIASGSLLYNIRSSNPVFCDNLQGWDVVGSGREIYKGGYICIVMAESS